MGSPTKQGPQMQPGSNMTTGQKSGPSNTGPNMGPGAQYGGNKGSISSFQQGAGGQNQYPQNALQAPTGRPGANVNANANLNNSVMDNSNANLLDQSRNNQSQMPVYDYGNKFNNSSFRA